VLPSSLHHIRRQEFFYALIFAINAVTLRFLHRQSIEHPIFLFLFLFVRSSVGTIRQSSSISRVAMSEAVAAPALLRLPG